MTISPAAPTAAPTTLSIKQLSPRLGGQVDGIDLTADLGQSTIDELQRALLNYKVLFFSGQNFTPETQRAFAERFGTLTAAHPVMQAFDDDHPELWEISSQHEGRNDIWHTDVTFVARPPKAAILRAVHVPEYGGDTSWADLEGAYESLSPAVQRLADELTAYHDGAQEFGETLKQRGTGNAWDGQTFDGFEPVEHPVVRIHPETGRKSLFVTPGFTTQIKDVTEEESKRLLEIFFAAVSAQENIVRHQWSAGDVAFWDNRCTAHYANNDYGDFHRVMHRITLEGDRPVGPAGH